MMKDESTPNGSRTHGARDADAAKDSIDGADENGAIEKGVGAGLYPDIAMSRNLARFTDDLVRVPGTSFGIGADAVVGLIPGVGDLIGTGMSTAIMLDAVRQRVPLIVLARMGANLLIDTGLGFIPGVGDVADVAHRANRKNYRLLERCVAEDRHVDTDARGYLLRAGAVVAGSVIISLVMVGFLIWGLITVIAGALG